MSPPPAVSVVIPTHDRLRYLRDAVASVRAQTVDDWELVVVDDGSRDGTGAYLEGLADGRVRVLERAHTGNVAAVRNVGIREARGEWVAFLDSDDRWRPRKLERQLAALEGDPRALWSYTGAVVIDATGQEVEDEWLGPASTPSGDVLEGLLRHDVRTLPSAVMARRGLLLEVGGFDETLAFCEDFDLWLRLARRSPAVGVDDRLSEIRRHASNLTADQPEIFEDVARIYRKCGDAASDPAIRDLCRRQRGTFLVRHANRLAAGEGPLRGIGALARIAPSEGWRPAWWAALGKALLRPFVPEPLRRRYRTARHAR